MFESSVNSEGIETMLTQYMNLRVFESSVNSEGIETCVVIINNTILFESSVNSEGIETGLHRNHTRRCLRAV